MKQETKVDAHKKHVSDKLTKDNDGGQNSNRNWQHGKVKKST